MSLTQRVKQGFLRLPNLEKALLIGSFVLMLSPLLPWYDNRNAFGVGDAYMGVQGPLFLIGILVAALGAVCFLQMALPLLGKNFFKARKSGGIAMAVGLQALVLVLISNSIFFHPAFGTNVTHKATRFGMVASFVGIAVLLIAGYFTYRKNKNAVDEADVEITSAMETEDVTPVEPVATATTSPSPYFSSYETPQAAKPQVQPVREDGIPARPNSPYSRPPGAYQGDPLQLDAKTRYKMMKSKQRESENGRSNLWQRGGGSTQEVTDSMKIRTDL